jgi:hypothetical protein
MTSSPPRPHRLSHRRSRTAGLRLAANRTLAAREAASQSQAQRETATPRLRARRRPSVANRLARIAMGGIAVLVALVFLLGSFM